jgi:hypothetical protein
MKFSRYHKKISGLLIILIAAINVVLIGGSSPKSIAANTTASLVPLKQGESGLKQITEELPISTNWISSSSSGEIKKGGYKISLSGVCTSAIIKKITVRFEVSGAVANIADTDAIISYLINNYDDALNYKTPELKAISNSAGFREGTNWQLIRGDDQVSSGQSDNGIFEYYAEFNQPASSSSIALIIHKDMSEAASGGLTSVTTSIPTVVIDYDDSSCPAEVKPTIDEDKDGFPSDKDYNDKDDCVPNPENSNDSNDCDKDTIVNVDDSEVSNPCIPDPAKAPDTADCDGDGVNKVGDPDDQDGCRPFIAKSTEKDDCDNDGVLKTQDSDDQDPCYPKDKVRILSSNDCDNDRTRASEDPDDQNPCVPVASIANQCPVDSSTTTSTTESTDTQQTTPSNSLNSQNIISTISISADDLDRDSEKASADSNDLDPCNPDPAKAPGSADCDKDGVTKITDANDLDPCLPDISRGGPNSDCDKDGVIQSADPDDGNACTPTSTSTSPTDDCDKDGTPKDQDRDDKNPCLPEPSKASPSADCDKDGTSKLLDWSDTNPCKPEASKAPNSADCDGDKELKSSDADDLDPCQPKKDTNTCDLDSDGLTTGQEQKIVGTDPAKKDTDSDSISDGDEYYGNTKSGRKTNPLNYCDPDGCSISSGRFRIGPILALSLILATIIITSLVARLLVLKNLHKNIASYTIKDPSIATIAPPEALKITEPKRFNQPEPVPPHLQNLEPQNLTPDFNGNNIQPQSTNISPGQNINNQPPTQPT